MLKSEITIKLELYDSLYESATELHNSYNLCNIRTDGGNSGTLVTCHYCPYFCCEGCRHMGPQGCRVKSLSCKLWLCEKALVKAPDAVKRTLGEMIETARASDLLHVRASRKDVERVLKGEPRKVEPPKHLKVEMFPKQ